MGTATYVVWADARRSPPMNSVDPSGARRAESHRVTSIQEFHEKTAAVRSFLSLGNRTAAGTQRLSFTTSKTLPHSVENDPSEQCIPLLMAGRN
ncbi:unnamed protein product [Heligmosomoides polygyrus]|uniref:Uncharacterized protein n=1 Tax=Heligmosomoides polygyrus TaxID=6339 RepID=A0A183FIE0_HELPZ|nr:unnamed protein product [Heligmosomoides polygyrus]